MRVGNVAVGGEGMKPDRGREREDWSAESSVTPRPLRRAFHHISEIAIFVASFSSDHSPLPHSLFLSCHYHFLPPSRWCVE